MPSFSIIEPRSSRHDYTVLTTTHDHDASRSHRNPLPSKESDSNVWQVKARGEAHKEGEVEGSWTRRGLVRGGQVGATRSSGRIMIHYPDESYVSMQSFVLS